MSAAINLVPRLRAALAALGRTPGVGPEELLVDLEDYVAQTVQARTAPPVVREIKAVAPVVLPAQPVKRAVKSRRRRVEVDKEPEPPTPQEAEGIPTWRDFFAFAPDQKVTRAALIEAYRRQAMGTTRELYYRLAKSEIPP